MAPYSDSFCPYLKKKVLNVVRLTRRVALLPSGIFGYQYVTKIMNYANRLNQNLYYCFQIFIFFAFRFRRRRSVVVKPVVVGLLLPVARGDGYGCVDCGSRSCRERHGSL